MYLYYDSLAVFSQDAQSAVVAIDTQTSAAYSDVVWNGTYLADLDPSSSKNYSFQMRAAYGAVGKSELNEIELSWNQIVTT